MVIYAATQGFMDDVPVNRVTEFQDAFLKYVDTRAAQLRQDMAQKKELKDEKDAQGKTVPGELERQLRQALTDFKASGWQK